MTRVSKSVVLIFIGLLLASCGGTRLTKTWRNPAYHGKMLANILVIGVSEQKPLRRSFENKFVNRLKAAGVNAHASHAVLAIDGKLQKDAVLAAVQKLGVDAVLITHLVDVQESEVYHPAQVHGFYDYYGRIYHYAHRPGYTTTHVKVALETSLYDVKTNDLVWSADSKTVNPGSKMEMFDNVIDAVVRDLQKQNLLPASK